MMEQRSPPMPRRKEPRIPDAILDQLLAGADAAPQTWVHKPITELWALPITAPQQKTHGRSAS